MGSWSWEPTVCIYHGNCLDGFGAAWAIWKRWPNCTFWPAYHGHDMPDIPDNQNVLFVDFSPPIDWIWKHSWKSKSMVIIDHHKTAQADLERLCSFDGSIEGLGHAFRTCWEQNGPELAAWFDMNQSGAMMAWQFAHGKINRDALAGESVSRKIANDAPFLLQMVEDRDLWRFEFGETTREVHAALRSYPLEFELWDKFEIDRIALISDGAAILRANMETVRQLVQQVAQCMVHAPDGTVLGPVPVVNAPYQFASDTGNALLEAYPDAPFAVTWHMTGSEVSYSLRSDNSRQDVAAVAKLFGGGGHRNASGFKHHDRVFWIMASILHIT
ncbi:hypothetical protein RvVAR031_36120 [Agrobacterium vitis]|nr:hypothetical protein RvVAR031_36120 [Agrobacterium vitis]